MERVIRAGPAGSQTSSSSSTKVVLDSDRTACRVLTHRMHVWAGGTTINISKAGRATLSSHPPTHDRNIIKHLINTTRTTF